MKWNYFTGTLLLIVALSLPCGFGGCGTNSSQDSSSTSDEPKWGGLTVITTGEKLENATCVVVMLHGLGGRANDLVVLTEALQVSPTTCFIYPEGPIEIRQQARAWMTRPGDFEKSCGHVLSLLEYISRQNSKAKIVLGGFSQGAILTSNLLSEEPQRLAGAILLAPSGQVRREPKDSPNKPLIFLAHGELDDILPFQGSEDLRQKLLDLNFEVDWFPFEHGHVVPPSVVPRLNQFFARIQSDSRTTTPRSP